MENILKLPSLSDVIRREVVELGLQVRKHGRNPGSIVCRPSTNWQEIIDRIDLRPSRVDDCCVDPL